MKEKKRTHLKVLEVYGSMEIIKILANKTIPSCSDAIACIGYFDGIHLGHQKLIRKVIELAKEKNCIPSCICFDNDPWIVMNKTNDVSQITPLSKRIDLLSKFGIKRIYLLHFDKDMMQMRANTFLYNVLNKLSLKALVCGNDFRFSYKGEGGIEILKKGNFELYIMDHVLYNQEKISSSSIEKLIKEGHIELANEQLGYSYSIDGIVIHGNKIGKTIGFPTANIQISENYIIPKKGVYSGKVKLFDTYYKAMINIGYNPTFNQVDHLSIEAHIIDFEREIYNTPICIYFSKFLREERKFASKEELIKQLNKDILIVREEM